MNRSFVLASVLAVAASACTADDCRSIATSSPLGAFLVGGDSEADAHRMCEALEVRKPQAMTGGGICAPRAGDDPCVQCARAHCCEVVDTCTEEACACRTEGCTSEQAAGMNRCLLVIAVAPLLCGCASIETRCRFPRPASGDGSVLTLDASERAGACATRGVR